MSKAVHSIWSHEDRKHLASVIMDQSRVPAGTRIEFRASKRTLGQNSLLWVLLTFVSENVEWHGVSLPADDWKVLFLAKLKRLRIVPNLDADGFVALGASTSELSKAEFGELIEAVYEFCATAGLTVPEHHPDRPPPGRRIDPPTIDHDENERPGF